MTDVQDAIAFLDRLAGRGRDLRASLAADASSAATAVTIDAMRQWQSDVASTVNELSGGSKAHWLSKAFSTAFLIATPGGPRNPLVGRSGQVEPPPRPSGGGHGPRRRAACQVRPG